MQNRLTNKVTIKLHLLDNNLFYVNWFETIQLLDTHTVIFLG